MKLDKNGPFDMTRKVRKPNYFWFAVQWIASTFEMRIKRHKIVKINCKGLKPPYIIISNHASVIDFITCVQATKPHRTQWVCSIEEYIGREGLFRSMGVLPKRKFVRDVSVVKNIMYAVKKNKKILTIYPEARYSLAGINEDIESVALAKLIKKAGVPLVFLKQYGHFLQSPQWNKAPTRKVKMLAEFKCLFREEDIEKASVEEIEDVLNKEFVYDDYKYQLDNKIKITSKYRANNIHKILYQCPHCGHEFSMDSSLTKLWCKDCGVTYEMDEYGVLHCLNAEAKFTHVPDWYLYERENVKKEVRENKYSITDKVRIEYLVNSFIGFKKIGIIDFKHDSTGIHLHGKLDDGTFFDLDKPVSSTSSIHIEFNFKSCGDAIDIALPDKTWFIYPIDHQNVLTKIHFATEELYKAWKENENE